MVLTPVLTMVGPATEARSSKDDNAESPVVSVMSTWGLFGPLPRKITKTLVYFVSPAFYSSFLQKQAEKKKLCFVATYVRIAIFLHQVHIKFYTSNENNFYY